MSMMHGWNPFMTMGSIWGVLWMLVLVALTVWAAVVLTRALLPRSGGSEGARNDDALDALRARYARGEIDEDEYRTRRETLTTTSGGR
jgi:putative membrane protein